MNNDGRLFRNIGNWGPSGEMRPALTLDGWGNGGTAWATVMTTGGAKAGRCSWVEMAPETPNAFWMLKVETPVGFALPDQPAWIEALVFPNAIFLIEASTLPQVLGNLYVTANPSLRGASPETLDGIDAKLADAYYAQYPQERPTE